MKLSKLIDQINNEYWIDEPTSKLRPVKFPKTTKKKTKKVVVINEPDSLKTISIKEIK